MYISKTIRGKAWERLGKARGNALEKAPPMVLLIKYCRNNFKKVSKQTGKGLRKAGKGPGKGSGRMPPIVVLMQ